MRRRFAALVLTWLGTLICSPPALADGSGCDLASYYDRHMALVEGVAYGWVGRGTPRRARAGVVQVGVSQDAYFALLDGGALLTWTEAPEAAATLMQGVSSFAAGQSGWFVIDRAQVLWHGVGRAAAPRRIAEHVIAACIGDTCPQAAFADFHKLIRPLLGIRDDQIIICLRQPSSHSAFLIRRYCWPYPSIWNRRGRRSLQPR